MAINFPSSPAIGDTVTVGTKVWRWDGTAWIGSSTSSGSSATLDNMFSLSGITTNGTTQTLTTNGSTAGASNQVILSNDTTVAFDILIVARRTDTDNEGAGFQFFGVIDRNTNEASTAIIGNVVKNVLAEDSLTWDANVSADTTYGGIKVEVTGQAAKTISWAATVWVTKVTG